MCAHCALRLSHALHGCSDSDRHTESAARAADGGSPWTSARLTVAELFHAETLGSFTAGVKIPV